MQLDNDVKSFEITKSADHEYNAWIRKRMEQMVWTSNLCNSWFKTKTGLIPTNFPGSTLLYWSKTFYPNMQHIRQVGGTKKLRGTSISREITKVVLTIMTVIALGTAINSNKPTIREGLSSANKMLYSTCREAVGWLRS